jgi:hypothetical protein
MASDMRITLWYSYETDETMHSTKEMYGLPSDPDPLPTLGYLYLSVSDENEATVPVPQRKLPDRI